MSLFYPPNDHVLRGKTSEAISFVTADPAYFGEVTVTANFEAVPGGTEVTLVFRNPPPGLRAADNVAGVRLNLKQMACRLE